MTEHKELYDTWIRAIDSNDRYALISMVKNRVDGTNGVLDYLCGERKHSLFAILFEHPMMNPFKCDTKNTVVLREKYVDVILLSPTLLALFIKSGSLSDINMRVNYPFAQTLLQFAATADKYQESAEYLVKCTSIDVNATGVMPSALYEYCRRGNYEMTRLLLQQPQTLLDCDISDNRLPAFHLSVIHGDIETVKEFLKHPKMEKPFEKNAKGFGAMHYASRFGHEQMIRLFLDDARINKNDL